MPISTLVAYLVSFDLNLAVEYSGLIQCSGEDALANLSIEKESEDGPVTGFVRIRSRSQGLALSLGALKGLNKAGGTVG